MRFIAAVIIILSAFFVTSRLQVNEDARFVTRAGEVLEGRVSRDFVTGQYKVEMADHSTRYVSQEEFGGMSSDGSAIPVYAGVLGFLMIGIAGCVGFGIDKAALGALKARARRMRPGFTHDRRPPSQRES